MAGALRNADLAIAVIDALTSQICVLDAEGVIVAVNAAWRDFGRLNGREAARSEIGVNYLELCRVAELGGQDNAGAVHDGIAAVLEGTTDLYTCEYECAPPLDHRWCLLRVSPLRRPWGRSRDRGIYGAVVSHADVTERKRLELELTVQARTDQLTGLANRRALMDGAERVRRQCAEGRSAAILMLDVDHFKDVNDTHGHAGGDRALVAIGEACRAVLRDGDFVSRLGGEEFAVLLPDVDSWGAVMTAERLRHAISQLEIGGPVSDFSVTVSVGVAEFQSGDASVDEALLRADRALYRAKSDGRNCVRVTPAADAAESRMAMPKLPRTA